ncbi:MAG: hypothetical protein A3J75_02940 [Acidobacteria bacterium RBG_16_68_9]|nr:MAG: hypothetical protein A3J75_02940 [Acidobacteria bacterium RBG_16_68_9]
MILCHCTGLSERAIVEMIHDGVTTAAEVARRSGAGVCCAACRTEIAALLAVAAPSGGPRSRTDGR